MTKPQKKNKGSGSQMGGAGNKASGSQKRGAGRGNKVAGSQKRDTGNMASTARILAKWGVGDLKTSTIISSISKTNFRVLSSYSWLARKAADPNPTIVVPGSPAQWNPPDLPKSLAPDSGFMVVTQNAYRLPHCPIEPLLQALFITQPQLNLNDVHIICDRNVLRRFYGFACSESKKFDIGIEMIKNTALFTILDGTVTGRASGYNRPFEKQFTKVSEVIHGMGEHYRIIGYTFGGLNLIVRYVADACDMIPTNTDIPLPATPCPPKTSVTKMTCVVKDPPGADPTESLVGHFSEMKLQGKDNKSPIKLLEIPDLPAEPSTSSSPPTKLWDPPVESSTSTSAPTKLPDPPAESTSSPLTKLPDPPAEPPTSLPPPIKRLSVRKAGKLVPQEHMVELRVNTNDCTPQCWFSNTSQIYIGVHKQDIFTAITKRTLDDAFIAEWEKAQSESLGKLAELLVKVVSLGKEHGGRMRIRCVNGELTLEHWEAKNTPQYKVLPLPQDLQEKWEVAV